MEETPLMNLDLRSPLIFLKIHAQMGSEFPPDLAKNEEILLCFDLDPLQSLNIEPDPELLLGSFVFAGRKTDGDAAPQGEAVSLPAGKYLFVQKRGVTPGENWLEMAIEQQKDGLWELYRPENRLFVRYLHEDGQFVIQLFRPL